METQVRQFVYGKPSVSVDYYHQPYQHTHLWMSQERLRTVKCNWLKVTHSEINQKLNWGLLPSTPILNNHSGVPGSWRVCTHVVNVKSLLWSFSYSVFLSISNYLLHCIPTIIVRSSTTLLPSLLGCLFIENKEQFESLLQLLSCLKLMLDLPNNKTTHSPSVLKPLWAGLSVTSKWVLIYASHVLNSIPLVGLTIEHERAARWALETCV